MSKVIGRLALAIALVLPAVVLSASPASADNGHWERTYCCGVPAWWHATNIYDEDTGITWWDAYEWWIDHGIYGHEVHDTFGPIQDEFAATGWEYGPFGLPWSRIYVAYYEGVYPVYRQGFMYGYIDWHTRNLCLCYDYGGYVTSYLY